MDCVPEDEDELSDSDDSTDYLLFVTSNNFRKHLGPTLQSALTECAADKPDDPIELIASILERFYNDLSVMFYSLEHSTKGRRGSAREWNTISMRVKPAVLCSALMRRSGSPRRRSWRRWRE